MSKKIIFGIGFLLITLRICFGINPPESVLIINLFKDTAHIFMGVLGTIWWYKRKQWQWYLFWVLNIVEISVAILSRL